MAEAKFEFGSPEWMKELHRLLVELARKIDSDDLDVAQCEVFTGVPKHLDRRGNGKIAWYCHIRGNTVEFGETERATTGRKVVGDYTFFLEAFARVHIDETNQAELTARLAQGVRDGLVEASGDEPQYPSALRFFVHNALAKITA